jgi:hypothetical protein
MNSNQTRPKQCGLCDETASYLTPFGLLCHDHARSFIDNETTWLPIPLKVDLVVDLPH